MNTADAPVVTRDLSDVAPRTAFSDEFRIDANPGGSATVNIPPGRRLVLEAVSVSGFVNRDGFHPNVLLRAVTAADVATYALRLTEVDPPGPIIDRAGNLVIPADAFAGTQLLRLYADSLQISVRYTDSTVEGTFMVTVSGYLVGQP